MSWYFSDVLDRLVDRPVAYIVGTDMAEQTEIGAYEAKTHLPAYLRKVRTGERFTITQRGQAIAELVPYGVTSQRAKQAAVRQLRMFMHERATTTQADIKALIEYGRD